jgi:glutamate-1-semialdehyde 2,1-aminomutase
LTDGVLDGPIGKALWQRADRVLPGGGIYYSRSADMGGRGGQPGFIESAQGCRVTDVDGRSYIDFMGANGPNLLGYLHPEVEAAARDQAARATSASYFPPALIELLEVLLDRYPAMGWGIAAKMGSETLTLAVRIARQHTQRKDIVTFTAAYHGSDPELAVQPPPGSLQDLTRQVHRVPWNDADALRALAAGHGEEIAAIVLNPLDQKPRHSTVGASEDFVAAIGDVQTHYGIQLVFDDVRHGFRLHPQGSEHLLGVVPDLVCLGKALGNGYAISALVGREALRPATRKIMYTSTYVFEAPPMRAAIATLEIYDRDRAFDHMTLAGQRLKDGLLAAADQTGHAVTITGPVTMPTLLFDHDPGFARQRSFSRHAAHLGAIFPPFLNWNLSLAHKESDIDEAIAIALEAFRRTPTTEEKT